jgi:hypothetical protein
MHVLKLFLGKYIFSITFLPVSDFLCETSGQSFSWVWMHAAQSSGQLSDTSKRAPFCRVLIWQWPSRRVRATFE